MSRFYRSAVNGRPVVEPFLTDEQILTSIYPCLNPAPFPAAQATDPHFVVTDAVTGTVTESPAITFDQASTDRTLSARVSGGWFVLNEGAPTAGATATLRLRYTGWDGNDNLAWLSRTSVGYKFVGITTAPDGTVSGNGQQCEACWGSDEIKYVGPDGRRKTAELDLDPIVPPTIPQATGAPTYSSETAYSGSPVTFSAGDFKPAGAVGSITYQWRFEKECDQNGNCTRGLGGALYGDVATGATVTHTWEMSRTLAVEVTATDSQGRQAVHTFDVPVANVPVELTVARDCATQAVPVGCNNYTPTQVGQVMNLFGGVKVAGRLDGFIVQVDWGDGTSSFVRQSTSLNAAENSASLRVQNLGRHEYRLLGQHTYAKAGYYTVTVRQSTTPAPPTNAPSST